MSNLIVHQLPGAWGLPSISPFCLKLDAYLRMVGIPFETIVDPTPFKGPKGKLPFIEHEGKKIGDSSFIIAYIEQRFGYDPDRLLSAAERASAHALQRLIEENLYWTMVYDRWMVEENWSIFRDVVLGGVPSVARILVGPIVRRGVKRQLAGHGMGLHSADEIRAIGRKDIRAVADSLGDKPFLMGAQPGKIDTIAYAFLVNILKTPMTSPVKDEGLKHGNLMAYLERCAHRWWPQ